VILRFESRDPSAYPAVIREMLETAGKKHLTTLVLPCLAAASLRKDDYLPACGRTYQALFQALETGGPSQIVLSLPKNLKTEVILPCVDSIKENWHSGLTGEGKSPGPLPTLYQSDLRLLLLFLPICLLVCSFRLTLTAKNYVIICIAFFLTGYEVQEKLTPLLSELAESVPSWIFKCALLAVLSIGFLFFAGLDVEGIFRKQDGNPPQNHG